MKSFLISDNRDTWVGLRLAGIDGIIVYDKDEALKSLKNAMQDKDMGIVILTEKIVNMLNDVVMEFKLKSTTPLIIEIPDRHGSMRESNAIADNIRESVGIHI